MMVWSVNMNAGSPMSCQPTRRTTVTRFSVEADRRYSARARRAVRVPSIAMLVGQIRGKFPGVAMQLGVAHDDVSVDSVAVAESYEPAPAVPFAARIRPIADTPENLERLSDMLPLRRIRDANAAEQAPRDHVELVLGFSVWSFCSATTAARATGTALLPAALGFPFF